MERKGRVRKTGPKEFPQKQKKKNNKKSHMVLQSKGKSKD
jgi:hypothetical protein